MKATEVSFESKQSTNVEPKCKSAIKNYRIKKKSRKYNDRYLNFGSNCLLQNGEEDLNVFIWQGNCYVKNFIKQA